MATLTPARGQGANPHLSILARFDNLRLSDFAAAASLCLVIFFGFDDFYFQIVARLCLIAALINPAWLRRWEFWAILSAASTTALLDNWSQADNHKYLFTYWVWVCALAFWAGPSESSDAVFKWHARFFVIFVFLAAAAQKAFSPTYMSGEMFELKVLLDDRFKAFAYLMGVDKTLLENVRLEFFSMKTPLTVYDDNTRAISSSDWIRTLSLWITWYDLIVQVLIGALFVPARATWDRLGHLVLLFFIFTTYLPAPVFGFGWTLCIFGSILAKDTFPLIWRSYLMAFIAILLYETPWRQWVLGV